jgi:hypothetical protein
MALDWMDTQLMGTSKKVEVLYDTFKGQLPGQERYISCDGDPVWMDTQLMGTRKKVEVLYD